jgi:membrane protease YdiL (CAAX protease family)
MRKEIVAVISYCKTHPLVVYFILAYAITWPLSWLISTSLSQAGSSAGALVVVGLLINVIVLGGPMLAAIIVGAVSEGRGGLKKLFGALRIWRISPWWYLFILAYPLVLHLLVVSIDAGLGGEQPVFFAAAYSVVSPLVYGLGVVVMNLLRGFGEEVGWRGFALPRLQVSVGPLRGSLILGILWGVWHFNPMNLQTLMRNPLWTLLSIIGTTFIFTWLYNRTQGSLLVAILFHASLNAAEWVIPLGLLEGDASRYLINTVLIWLFVAILFVVFGAYPRYRGTFQAKSG